MTDSYIPCHNTLPGMTPEDVTLAMAEARLRVNARRAARRQHVGVTFAPDAKVVKTEFGTFVEGSLLYPVHGEGF